MNERVWSLILISIFISLIKIDFIHIERLNFLFLDEIENEIDYRDKSGIFLQKRTDFSDFSFKKWLRRDLK